MRVLKTPVRAPQVNPFCEWMIGTMRRERLDSTTLGTSEARRISREWGAHYNQGAGRMRAWDRAFPIRDSVSKLNLVDTAFRALVTHLVETAPTNCSTTRTRFSTFWISAKRAIELARSSFSLFDRI